MTATKVHVFRNGADLGQFRPGRRDPSVIEEMREWLGARPNEILVLYAGAHGISHGLVTVAETARLLVGDGVHFAFVGEGAAKVDLLNRVTELNLSNVTLRSGVPHEAVPNLLAAADVCLVPLRDVPLFMSFIPSKIFEYLGAGRAVIGALRGEPAAILREAGAVVVEPENAPALADAIRVLSRDPAERLAMGRHGRAYVEQHFDRSRIARSYLEMLMRLDEARYAV